MTTTPARLTVLAGPTAVGKGTVSADVRSRYPEVWLSVSATTRPPRPGEVDGVHYLFVSVDEFDRMVERGDLLESLPGVGKVKARAIISEIGIDESLHLVRSETAHATGLGPHQVKALVDRFG